MEVTKVKKTNCIEFTLTDSEYDVLNDQLEKMYKLVTDSRDTSSYELLWKFKDMLTMAIKG
jgi:hypothetical protein